MFGFVFAVVLTLAISFWCSLLEAIILSTTTAEIEALKRTKPARGALLEKFRHHMDETIRLSKHCAWQSGKPCSPNPGNDSTEVCDERAMRVNYGETIAGADRQRSCCA